MTTICVDKDLNMASDSQSTQGGMRTSTTVKKIFELNGYVVGFAGRYAEALKFIEALADIVEHEIVQSGTYLQIPQPVIEQMDEFNALVITPAGTVLMYEGSSHCYPVEVPVAIGSGSDYAWTALECGKTASEAVEIAMKFDVFSGGDVQVVALPELKEVPSREERALMSKEELLEFTNELLGDYGEDSEREQTDESGTTTQ